MFKRIITNLIIISIIIFIYFFQIIIVSGDSMQPTYDNHDLLLCNKRRAITVGDIIVFNHDGIKIKRVVASTNDHIELKSHKVYVNNIQINPYTSENNQNYQLKNNQYFVIGDNYQNSYDSRKFGPINNSDVICSIPQHKKE